MSTYKFRPHHGLCIMFFEGKGYNEKFIKNMYEVIKIFKNRPTTEIILNSSNDIICSACPLKGTNCVEESLLNIDNTILSMCNLKNGEKVKFCDFKELICKNVISLENLENICNECRWIAICKKNLKCHYYF